MTENEAIEEIKSWTGVLMSVGSQCTSKTAEAQEMAIKALLEIQQHRAIGTVEECRVAVERMKPKKVIIKEWTPVYCPTCNEELSELIGDGYYKHYTYLKYCPNCGQVLSWEEED